MRMRTRINSDPRPTVAKQLALRSTAWANGGWTNTPIVAKGYYDDEAANERVAPAAPNAGPAYRFNQSLAGGDHYSDLDRTDWTMMGLSSPRLSVEEARLQFLDWLQQRHPLVYSRAMGFDSGLADAGGPVSVTATGDDTHWYDSLAKALPSLVSTYAQVKLINTNLKRADAGLPPLDSGSVAPTVKVAPDAATARTINGVGIAVMAVGGFVVLKLLGVIGK